MTMRSRFVIIAKENLTPEARNAITLAIKSKHGAFWHWFQFGWLVISRRHRDPEFWRDLVQEAAPRANVVVVRIGDGSWSAFGNKKEFRWLHDSWSGSKQVPLFPPQP